MKKIAIFVDVQNIYYTTKQAFGKSFNYRKFWQQTQSRGKIINATAYAIQSNNDGQKKFQDALKHIGFEVKLKPYIQRKDGSAKGDWDVGITIDIMEIGNQADIVILLSGDGDFDLLMKKIKSKHQLQTEVYSVLNLTANSLIQSIDTYHQIDDSLLL